MIKLSKKKKYLKAIFNSYALLKNDQYLSQRLLEKAHSNISIFRLSFTHGKNNNQAPCRVETRTSSKKCYKAYQIK